MVLQLIIALLVPTALSLLLTPGMMWLAPKIGAIDQPNDRKIHTDSTPRMGGVAVFLSFSLSLGAILILFPQLESMTLTRTMQGTVIALSLVTILALGIWDDIKTLNPGIKFLIQFIVATVIYLAGFKISVLTAPLTNEGLLQLGLLDFPLTILWIIGISNAFNLIDGLDGLASGVSIIALLTISIISFTHQDMETALIGVLLIGAILGFLWYNFHPAQIFLGDSGSLFIGFSLAALSIQSYTKVSTAFAILVPALALGLPILDTFVSMIRRFLSWFLPQKYRHAQKTSLAKKLYSMFLPDKSHIHHQIIGQGISHRNTVLLLYLVSGIFGVGAITVTMTTANTALLILTTVSVMTIIGVRMLQYKEMDLLRNGITLTLYDRLIIKNELFQRLLDFGFIVIAFIMGVILTTPITIHDLVAGQVVSRGDALTVIALVSLIQYGIFWIRGLYKEPIHKIGLMDVIKVLKIAATAVILTGLVFLLASVPAPFNQLPVTTYLLNFYFLVSLVLGIRLTFHVLKYLFHRYRKTDRKVIIYGTGENGQLALQKILNSGSYPYSPVGFLDDDPTLEGKFINGYPIYGGHWKLQKLINKYNVSQILLTKDVKPEILRRIKTIISNHQITVHKFRFRLEDVMTESDESVAKRKEYVYAE